MSETTSKRIWSLLWREYGVQILLNSVIVIAITLGISRLALPNLGGLFTESAIRLIACGVTLVLSAPFLWGIVLGGRKHRFDDRPETIDRLRALQVGVSAGRFLVGFGVTGFVVSHFTTPLAFTGFLFVALSALGIFFFSGVSGPLYERIERRFIENLTANERAEIEKKRKIPELAPWNATLAEFVVSPNSPCVLKTLQDSRLKERFGVTITMIERGDQRILAPKREDLLLPGDRLFVIGTEEEMGTVREWVEEKPSSVTQEMDANFGLASVVLRESDSFVHKPIRECGIRESVNGLIVGLEREGRRYLSPDSAMVLLPGDRIWLVGDQTRIRKIRSDG